MKRFITYVFEHDNGVKGKNVGFIKTDIRDNQCRMQIHLQHSNRIQGKGTVYLLIKEKELEGIYLGDMMLRQGRGEMQSRFAIRPLLDTDYDFSQVVGVAIKCPNECYLASCWEDAEQDTIANGKFQIWENKMLEVEEVEEQTPEPEEQQEEPIQKEMISDSYDAELRTLEVQLERIDIEGIRKLPKKNWYLSHNSFLLHGYANYQYLIIKKEVRENEVRHFLGVPGIYEKPERVMATLFGFPEFSLEDESKNFGYWLCPLEM